MRCVFVCPDDFLWRLASDAGEPALSVLYLVEDPRVRARIVQRGGEALAGDLETEAVYRRALRDAQDPVLVAVERARQARVVAAVRAAAPEAPIVVLSEDHVPGGEPDGVVTLTSEIFVDRVLGPELERAATRARVDRIRAHFERADRILIMMQDDPDPDAIASALALRMLLGRNKTAAPLATFGTITRSENRAMTRILEIDVEQIKPRALEDFDAVAIVDAQPSFFEEPLGEVDLVIDHHPEESPVRARIKDVRPSYGATATILTEYLRAADVKLTQRVATALLYGIKADTQHMERGAAKADMEAFAYVHAHANHSALRRIERPALSNEALDVLAQGIASRRVVSGVVFAHLGAIPYPELVPQFADFFLQVEDVEWSVVSGVVHGELHVSVRNVGYVRGAGEVVRKAFGDLGGAGGHRSMAKAVIRLRDWRARVGGGTGARAVGAAVAQRFLRALRA